MKYKMIKNTDLKVSSICLGTAEMGSVLTQKDSFAMLDYFQEKGGNIIDTAHVYANWLPVEKSISEKTIGLWLKERGCREKILISTKGGHPNLKTMNIPRLSDREILQDLDDSLKFLRTDYIDLYWLHRDDPGRPAGELIEFLNGEVKKGKIRYFGCSNWKTERIKEAQAYAEKKGLMSFCASQIMWSLARPNREAMGDPTIAYMNEEEKKFYMENKFPVLAFTSQARGFFSKLDQGKLPELKEWVKKTYYNEYNMKVYTKLKILSAEMGVPITALVLGYLTSQPFTAVPIVGNQSLNQLNESIAAADVNLSESILQYLDEDIRAN